MSFIVPIEVAMIGTRSLGVRLSTLALVLPLLALTYAVVAADGPTQRAISLRIRWA